MTFGSMVAVWTSAWLIAAPAATSDPVPVQRPSAAPPPSAAPDPIAPTEAPAAPPTAAPTEAPSEAPTEAPSDVPTEAPVEAPVEATPTEAVSSEVAVGAPAPVVVADDDLDEVTEEEVAAATPIEDEQREAKIRRAQTMIAAGSIAAIGGFVMAIAAGIEGAKPECKFGLDDCSNAPRPNVTAGLAIGATIGLAAGAALLGVGVYKLRKVRASIVADGRTAGLVISGRF